MDYDGKVSNKAKASGLKGINYLHDKNMSCVQEPMVLRYSRRIIFFAPNLPVFA